MQDTHYKGLALAQHMAGWSKDPSTHVGAVLVDAHHRVLGVGYNGFPRGVADDSRLEQRDQKYDLIIHAEMNALLNSQTHDLREATLYCWPMPPCVRCMVHLIQAGLKDVVTVHPTAPLLARWGDSFRKTEQIIREVGGRIDYVAIADSPR